MIRFAGPDDIPDLIAVYHRARAAAMPWLPNPHTRQADHWFFENKVLGQQTVIIWGVPGTVGYAAYCDGWLNHLYVDPEYWGQGIGSALFDRACADTGPLRLWAFRDNHAARAFYARRGLQVVDETDGQNVEGMPDVCMAQPSLHP